MRRWKKFQDIDFNHHKPFGAQVNHNFSMAYKNYYHCKECKQRWKSDWLHTCNDKCPNCNSEIQPYKSEQIIPELEKSMRESLEYIIENCVLSTQITDLDKNELVNDIMSWLISESETVESLFNPDEDDGLMAVPLLWTKTEGG